MEQKEKLASVRVQSAKSASAKSASARLPSAKSASAKLANAKLASVRLPSAVSKRRKQVGKKVSKRRSKPVDKQGIKLFQ